MKNKDSGKVAIRYARALLEASLQAELEDTASALKELATAWSTNSELRSCVLNPAIPLAEREQILRDVVSLTGQKLSQDAASKIGNLLVVMLQNARIVALPDVVKEFAILLAQLKQTMAVSLVAAYDLNANEKQELENKVRKECGELTSFTWSIDQNLIGGLLIKVGDKVLDNTVKGSLDQLRQELMQ